MKDLHKAAPDTHPDKNALKSVIDAFAEEMGAVNKKKGEADEKLKTMAETAATYVQCNVYQSPALSFSLSIGDFSWTLYSTPHSFFCADEAYDVVELFPGWRNLGNS